MRRLLKHNVCFTGTYRFAVLTHYTSIPRMHWQTKYDLSLYTLNLSVDNDLVNIVPTHAAPHYSLWGRAFELENPHTSPPSFPRQSHIVFLWCSERKRRAEKQLLDHPPHMQQILSPLSTTGNGTKTTGAIHRNCNSPASMYAIQRIQGGGVVLLSKQSIASLSLSSGIQYIPGSQYKQTVLTPTLHFQNTEV
jgi:hypothetical protein